MKTRKYKDNQQRKNFAKNESNILLIQYFKRYAFGSEAFKKKMPNLLIRQLHQRTVVKATM